MADTQELKQIIQATAEATTGDKRWAANPNEATKMESTNFLRSTGLLDGYESVVTSMIEEGWPQDQSIFEHAAYLLLRWQSEN